jgi:hypothetical protein
MEAVGEVFFFVHCNTEGYRICGIRGWRRARDEAENYTCGILLFIFLK